jgi:hypothetical protein
MANKICFLAIIPQNIIFFFFHTFLFYTIPKISKQIAHNFAICAQMRAAGAFTDNPPLKLVERIPVPLEGGSIRAWGAGPVCGSGWVGGVPVPCRRPGWGRSSVLILEAVPKLTEFWNSLKYQEAQQ